MAVLKRKRLLPLTDLTAKFFAKNLLNSLEAIYAKENEAQVIDQIKDYLHSCTTPAYQKLLETICCFCSPALVLAIELLFNNTFKDFNAPKGCDDPFRLANAIATRCASLEYLDLSNLDLDELYWMVFRKMIQDSPNLKEIKLPTISNNGLWLPLLKNYCPRLRHISTPNVLQLGNLVPELFKSTLTSIDIFEYDFDTREYMAEITPIVKHCSITSISPAIRIYDMLQECYRENPNFKCNLENLCVRRPDAKFARTIISTCPKLTDFELCAPTDCSLQIFGRLPLRRLVITDFDYQDLLGLLEEVGPNLETLELRLTRKKSALNVLELFRLCPRLSKLKLSAVNARYVGNLESIPSLEKFYLLDCQFERNEFTHFLKCLRNLKEFYASVLPLTDEDIQRILCQDTFKDLKTFYVRKASNLTIRSVCVLLEFCQNLEYVGHLYNWNISEKEIKSIPCMEKAETHVIAEIEFYMR